MTTAMVWIYVWATEPVRVPRAHTSIYKGWLPSNINVSRIPMVFVQHKRNNYLRDGSRSPDVDVQA